MFSWQGEFIHEGLSCFHVEDKWEMQSCLNVWTKHTGSPGLSEFQWILTTLLLEGSFKFPFLTNAWSVISAGKRLSWPSHLNITVSVYIIVYILFVGQSWTFEEDAPVVNLLLFFVHIAGQDLTFDLTGQRSYMEACEKLHVVPSSAFLRQIQSNQMLLMHRCLGHQVSCDQAEAFSRIFPSWIQLVALDRSNKYAQIVCV